MAGISLSDAVKVEIIELDFIWNLVLVLVIYIYIDRLNLI